MLTEIIALYHQHHKKCTNTLRVKTSIKCSTGQYRKTCDPLHKENTDVENTIHNKYRTEIRTKQNHSEYKKAKLRPNNYDGSKNKHLLTYTRQVSNE